MSYDFMLVKTTAPISELSELEEDKVSAFRSWESVKSAIETVLPDVNWDQSDGALWGITKTVEGRFEILIADYAGEERQAYAMFHVLGSHRANQRDVVVQIAKETDFSVFDMQTMEMLHQQQEFA